MKRASARAVPYVPEPPPPGIPMPVRVVSESNHHTHWRERYTRGKQQAFMVRAFLEAWRREGNPWPQPPLTVTLTKLGPAKLDRDNLGTAFKAIRDAIAKWLAGIDDPKARAPDDDELITWEYAQEYSRAHSIRVLFEERS